MSIMLKDRLDRKFSIKATNGDRILSILNKNHIPLDAIILKKNEEIVDDYNEIFNNKDSYVIEMVRAYHLPDFLSLMSLWDYKVNSFKNKDNIYYTKRLNLHSQKEGDFKFTQTHFGKNDFVEYIEKVFVDGIKMNNLIEDGDKILLALSGGRDSLSIAYFLSRNRKHLPSFQLEAVHVETSSNSLETQYCKEICHRFDIPLRIFTNNEVKENYNLKETPEIALRYIKDDYNKSYSIFATHNIIRTSVEKVAKEGNYSKIIYGLMKEDVVISILKGYFIGMPFKGPISRKFGSHEIIYPIWSISKKELTLYLEAIAQEHNHQGSPSKFERGAMSRDIYYFIVDTLETICPGISYQIVESNKIISKNYTKDYSYKNCTVCGCTFTNDYNGINTGKEKYESDICDLCSMFKSGNLVTEGL